jgi:hypothetical protein
MTKKDYELIAKPLNLLVKCIPDIDNGESASFVVNQVVNKFMRDLEAENPLFNREKFLKAVNEG